MNKNSITQYKSLFNSIVKHIESDDAKEQIEVWFAHELETDIGLCPLEVITEQIAGIGYEISFGRGGFESDI